MNTPDRRHQLVIGLLLALLMAVTRFNHFGSPVSLPDASLAVFFLAGVYLTPAMWFPLFILEAALLDLASVAGGVSDWCVTAAYGFLIPAYACPWLAGRWFAPRARPAPGALVAALGMALAAAFAISNGSFYLFSGYFESLGWTDYMRAVIGYFPAYAGYTLMYVGAAACVHGVARALPGRFRRFPAPESGERRT